MYSQTVWWKILLLLMYSQTVWWKILLLLLSHLFFVPSISCHTILPYQAAFQLSCRERHGQMSIQCRVALFLCQCFWTPFSSLFSTNNNYYSHNLVVLKLSPGNSDIVPLQSLSRQILYHIFLC